MEGTCSDANECLDGYICGNNNIYLHPNISAEYEVHLETKTHAEAINACNGLGKKLFEPKDSSANSEAFALAQANGVTSFWIGIHDITNEGKFTYDSNGETIGYDNWSDNEPNNFGNVGEDCAEMNENGEWNDLPCNSEKPFLCERIGNITSLPFTIL